MLAAMLALGGCLSIPDVSRSLEKRDHLLDGSAVFGEPVGTEDLVDVNILEPSDDMLAFIEREVGDTRHTVVRFRRLFHSLINEGYLATGYSADVTRTAAETFAQRSGNCLSYTNMFIALAREAGIDARFQVVDVPPSWDADSGYLIRYTHVNVLVKGFVFDSRYGEEFSVDFNDVLPDPDQPRRAISDAEARSLFYANRSVHYLRANEQREAFQLLKKAIELAPDNEDLWINLGAFYSKQGAYEEALAAYEIALHYDRNNRGAVSGLARAHSHLGNTAEAEKYAEQVRSYRQRNPYFHYAVAQAEFEQARYDKALEAINTAIDLKFRNGRFHFLKGLTQTKLGELDEAEESFRLADRFGNYRDLEKRYGSGLAGAQPVG
jgi:Flp pilus assembly protein TadD